MYGNACKKSSLNYGPSLMQTLMLCMSLNTVSCKMSSVFESYLQESNKPIGLALIADACTVVDVLGSDVRTHLIERFVALELKEYRRIFRTSDEAGQLDNISRRFAWFRRLLQNHEIEHGRVFPAEWRVSWHLLAKFTEITRCVCVVNCIIIIVLTY